MTINIDDELVRAILRPVRGCATDSQYTDAYDRAGVALANVRQEARAAAFREAAILCRGQESPEYDIEVIAFGWEDCKLHCAEILEAATTKHPCPDCAEAARLAYSDAVTPGFFNPKCARHQTERATTTKQPEVKEGADG